MASYKSWKERAVEATIYAGVGGVAFGLAGFLLPVTVMGGVYTGIATYTASETGALEKAGKIWRYFRNDHMRRVREEIARLESDDRSDRVHSASATNSGGLEDKIAK